MKVHELKCLSDYFEAVRSGAKSFEMRKADRDFAVGDVLWLREVGGPGFVYTGRNLRRLVTYVLPGGQFGVEEGYVALGLSRD